MGDLLLDFTIESEFICRLPKDFFQDTRPFLKCVNLYSIIPCKSHHSACVRLLFCKPDTLPPILCTTEPECGPCKKSENKNSSHVDWWIYKDSHPEEYFKEVR